MEILFYFLADTNSGVKQGEVRATDKRVAETKVQVLLLQDTPDLNIINLELSPKKELMQESA